MAKPNPLTLSPHAASFISAALRHIRDAEHLLESPSAHCSPDQAYHLAGFAPECARKGTLSLRWLDHLIGHAVDPFSEELLELAIALDPIAHRYNPLAYATRYPTLVGWTVDARYEHTGTRKVPEATAICAEAREAVDAVVIALWADGRLPDKDTPW
jgi:hypothetical protein